MTQNCNTAFLEPLPNLLNLEYMYVFCFVCLFLFGFLKIQFTIKS